ncbi:MAG: hypothetical protein A2Y15_07195 [Clostridiales bacterium GWF2_36_10]|nr:MAG: hypothetical protein A2Y15_07195 [Clostridiales bacterium GWF2_36_10]HAN21329.1 hypothetical protein [Clostridiales bacterium]
MTKFKENSITATSIKKQRWDIVKELNKSQKRGCVLDVLELEGSYALDNSEEIFEKLTVCDRLTVCESNDAPNKEMLTVMTEEGKTVGFLPGSISILPRLLLNKGCGIYCYVEYIDFTNKLLTIVVSLYVNNY